MRDYFIADAALREILALGPETAVPELLKIIDVTLDSFLADKLMDDERWETYYLFHALYLLHELQAPEALDVYRRVLLLNLDSIEFWFDDVLFEGVSDNAGPRRSNVPAQAAGHAGRPGNIAPAPVSSFQRHLAASHTGRVAARHQRVFAVLPAPHHRTS